MSQARFSEGESVVIRDADFLKTQGGVFPSCVPEMIRLAGREATVTSCNHYSKDLWLYRIDIDDGRHTWNENWFVTDDNTITIDESVLGQFDELL